MRPRLHEANPVDEAVAGPRAFRSLLPLASAAFFFFLGVAGLAGWLPFVESSFTPGATPVPGAIGRNPQPLPTRLAAVETEPLPDLDPVFEMLRQPFTLPTVAVTPKPASPVFSVGSGSVRAVVALEPTATPTAIPVATPTATPTNPPEPTPTPSPEPTATPAPETPVAPQPAPGTWNPSKPEVALFDPSQPVETPPPDNDYGGYSTLPPPQE